MQSYTNYLAETLGLSPKIVKRHTTKMAYFINDVLLENCGHLPTSRFKDLYEAFTGELSDSIADRLETSKASANKCYHFLELAGEIDKKQEKEAKEWITEGNQFGSYINSEAFKNDIGWYE